jgi:hypothetical protein
MKAAVATGAISGSIDALLLEGDPIIKEPESTPCN